VPDYMQLSLEQFLDEVASADLLPGAGFVAAYGVAMAAGLVSMTARLSSGHWTEARAVSAQAETVRHRVTPLAELNARAYQRALSVLKGEEEGPKDPRDSRDDAIAEALDEAARIPLQIGESACDVAALAATVAERGEPAVRADAAVAALVSYSSARAAATLVEVNLSTTSADERLAEARNIVGTASLSLERALAAVPS
jgi:formiminotetrahydrofolate cyclodeaminase